MLEVRKLLARRRDYYIKMIEERSKEFLNGEGGMGL